MPMTMTMAMPPPPTPPRPPAQGPPGDALTNHNNIVSPEDSGAPKYDHAGSRNCLIRCRTALWRAPAAPRSPRPTRALHLEPSVARLEPLIKCSIGASKLLPWPFGAFGLGQAGSS